ncbi:hypothetical protein NUW54_g3262 [Trametes sanguinea]|uniref:Uncharacterized protein n=1 Tax=Trametes sanguinea TaxID=158606 RepID=A0ACC1Q190_9APHY|nr:hypothetical protein NUW54_g3262 [Trametes sanguinea]
MVLLMPPAKRPGDTSLDSGDMERKKRAQQESGKTTAPVYSGESSASASHRPSQTSSSTSGAVPGARISQPKGSDSSGSRASGDLLLRQAPRTTGKKGGKK